MKKLLIVGLLAGVFFYSDFCQVTLLNKTGKSIDFAFKFVHTEAKQKMNISGFTLKPHKKTVFPKEKDLGLAIPLKLKVNLKSKPEDVVSEVFERDDLRNFEVRAVRGEHGNIELKKTLVE